VGSQERNPEMHYPDFEVRYKIEDNGIWTAKGESHWIDVQRVFNAAREDEKRLCSQYDTMFATALISDRLWKLTSTRRLQQSQKG
jgi:hypothetical protein